MEKEYKSDERLLINDLTLEKSSAIKFIYDHYFKTIQFYIQENSGDYNDAQDVFQEAVIVLINNLRKGNYNDKSKLKAYFKVISRNIWIDQLRKRKTHTIERGVDRMEEDKFTVEHESETELNPRQKLLKMQFGKLKEDCQHILDAFYYKSATMKEIALMNNYTEQFVRVKKNRCMNYLKKLISNV